jgi:hypothetical protein
LPWFESDVDNVVDIGNKKDFKINIFKTVTWKMEKDM